MSRQIDEQVPQALVGAHGAVVARGVFIADPQAVLVEHDLFAGRAAGNQPANPSVADGQRFVDERRRRAIERAAHRLLVPQYKIAGIQCRSGAQNDQRGEKKFFQGLWFDWRLPSRWTVPPDLMFSSTVFSP